MLANLFGTPRRVALGMGEESVEALREVGKLLAFLIEPEPPKGMKDAWEKLPIFKQVLDMSPKEVSGAHCQEVVIEGADVDLSKLPIQTCWPGDAGPLITWGLVITKGPNKERQNLGIYRQQVIGKNKVIMRWLSHRGGALDFREWQQKHPGEPFPIAVALGADPATILGAVTPEAFYRLGLIYLSEKKWPEARNEFKRALSLETDFSESRAELREAEFRLGSSPGLAAPVLAVKNERNTGAVGEKLIQRPGPVAVIEGAHLEGRGFGATLHTAKRLLLDGLIRNYWMVPTDDWNKRMGAV